MYTLPFVILLLLTIHLSNIFFPTSTHSGKDSGTVQSLHFLNSFFVSSCKTINVICIRVGVNMKCGFFFSVRSNVQGRTIRGSKRLLCLGLLCKHTLCFYIQTTNYNFFLYVHSQNYRVVFLIEHEH